MSNGFIFSFSYARSRLPIAGEGVRRGCELREGSSETS